MTVSELDFLVVRTSNRGCAVVTMTTPTGLLSWSSSDCTRFGCRRPLLISIPAVWRWCHLGTSMYAWMTIFVSSYKFTLCIIRRIWRKLQVNAEKHWDRIGCDDSKTDKSHHLFPIQMHCVKICNPYIRPMRAIWVKYLGLVSSANGYLPATHGRDLLSRLATIHMFTKIGSKWTLLRPTSSKLQGGHAQIW